MSLPPDIIRKVVAYSAQSSHSTKEISLVSHLWKDFLDETLSQLSKLTPIDELELTPSSDTYARNSNIFLAHLKIQKGRGFPLRVLYEFGFEDVETEVDNMTILRKAVQFGEFEEGRTNALSALKQIDKVVINDMSERVQFLTSILKKVQTDVIAFKEQELTDGYSTAILKLVRRWNATRVYLSITDNLCNKRVFLLALADLIDVLRVDQFLPQDDEEGDIISYIFDEVDCLRLITEMFTKRVSMIRIRHDNEDLVRVDDDLKEFLQVLSQYKDKKPWLEFNVYGLIANPMRLESNNLLMTTENAAMVCASYPSSIVPDSQRYSNESSFWTKLQPN